MSVLFMSVGQCGVQVGYDLWREVDHLSSAHHPGHTHCMVDGSLPWILVDTEHKANTISTLVTKLITVR